MSYDSTSYELSDKTRFEYFSRTVPHDLYQARAIVDIVRYFNWSYISVVYSDDNYGNLGIHTLKEAAAKSGKDHYKSVMYNKCRYWGGSMI